MSYTEWPLCFRSSYKKHTQLEFLPSPPATSSTVTSLFCRSAAPITPITYYSPEHGNKALQSDRSAV